MIVVLEPEVTEEQIAAVEKAVRAHGASAVLVEGKERSVLAILGDTRFDQRELEVLPGVREVLRVSKPYKLASREVKREDTAVHVGDVTVGGDQIVVMAGPCSVENRPMLFQTARALAAMGVPFLRGGAFKPRTSPYAFQGLGVEGLKILRDAADETGMKVVTEVMAPEKVELVARYADVLQIGARNMQNFDLLKAVAEVDKPVLLKRGLSGTIEEWLMAAEYVLAGGRNRSVILCERGIRTFETATRNTLDLNAVPVLKQKTHLPVVVDPSHGTGVRAFVIPLALAAVAAGADGVMIETHPEPEKALSDGPQSLYLDQVGRLLKDLQAIAPVVGRRLELTTHRPRLEPGRKTTRRLKKSDRPRVGFQGVAGAFSESALRQFFGERVEAAPFPGFEDVFAAVERGELEAGMIPIENSLAGSVHQNVDNLLAYDVKIIGEHILRVQHHLIANRGTRLEQVKTVYAHPQAAGQCARFLRAHPQWTVLQTYDTAGSVAYIRDQKLAEAAAIAGRPAAERYHMEILVEAIEDDPRNYTRFVVIGGARAKGPPGDKCSIIYTTANKPGALVRTLQIFSRRQINLTKLESRPIPGRPWEYRFSVDLEGAEKDPKVREALEELRAEAASLKFLGCYPAAR
jgi:3-deoxy-7-phosphoheptulonate synthase